MTEPTPQDPFESRLQAHFNAPSPDGQFAARLEARLRAESIPPARAPFFARRAWLVGLALVLALAGGVLLAGPGRVLAMLQGLIGYVPGVGMLELDGSLILAEPVTYSQDGTTLTVEQVIANPQKTTLLVSLRDNSAGVPVFLERGRLRLPDGTEWNAMNSMVNAYVKGDATAWSATLEFPPLPRGVQTFTFVWARYKPPSGYKLLELWQVALTLQPVSDPRIAAQFSPGYSLEDASVTHGAFTLQVLQVASTADRTVVHVRYLRPAQPRVDAWPLTLGAFLEDQAGRRYTSLIGEIDIQDQGQSPEIVPCPAGDGQCYALSQHLVFNRVPDSVTRLALHLPRFNISWDPRASIDLDLGPAPAPGDTFPLDIDLPLPIGAGTIHLSQARIQSMPVDDGLLPALLITASEQPAAGDFSLEGLWFFTGSNRLIPGVLLWENGKIPAGPLTAQIGMAQGTLRGPWVVAWDVPAR